jgi:tRNA pseudouridine-54 N-methylase
MHADERSIAGQIGKILREPIPPVGHLRELSAGMWHSGGDVSTTITEWNREGVQMLRLDAESQRIWKSGASIVNDPTKTVTRGFFLSDDRPFSTEEIDLLEQSMPTASLGDRCIQGHAAIAVLHQLLDWNVPLSV